MIKLEKTAANNGEPLHIIDDSPISQGNIENVLKEFGAKDDPDLVFQQETVAIIMAHRDRPWSVPEAIVP